MTTYILPPRPQSTELWLLIDIPNSKQKHSLCPSQKDNAMTDIFNREPIRRSAVAMTTNKVFLESNRGSPNHLRQFGLKSVTLYRFGYQNAGTPLQRDNEKRLFLISLEVFAFWTPRTPGFFSRLSHSLRFGFRCDKYPAGLSRPLLPWSHQRL